MKFRIKKMLSRLITFYYQKADCSKQFIKNKTHKCLRDIFALTAHH